jgi:hypothetical protein
VSVSFGPASIIGYALAALAGVLAAIDALAGSGLGGDGELLAKIAAIVAVLISLGRQAQAIAAELSRGRADRETLR